MTIVGVWTGDLIEYFQSVTIRNYNTIANLHTSQITITHGKLPHSAFTGRFPVTDLNNEDSSASVITSLLSGEYPITDLNSKLV
jgi:hypothetical protein